MGACRTSPSTRGRDRHPYCGAPYAFTIQNQVAFWVLDDPSLQQESKDGVNVPVSVAFCRHASALAVAGVVIADDGTPRVVDKLSAHHMHASVIGGVTMTVKNNGARVWVRVNPRAHLVSALRADVVDVREVAMVGKS